MDPETRRYHLELPRMTFQGRLLPRFAFLMDHAANIPSLSEETRVWFWRFSISAGGRTDTSKAVLHHSAALLRVIDQEGLAAIPSSVSAELYDLPMVLNDWMIALKQMIEDANAREICDWSAEKIDIRDIPKSAKGQWQRGGVNGNMKTEHETGND